MATNSTPGSPTVDEGLPPHPPAFGDDDEGGDHRDEHKLALMLCLSRFVWTRMLVLASLTELPRSYVQSLLEELEEEGLVRMGYRRLPRLDYFITEVIHRRRCAMGHELTAALTEEGRKHPKLVELEQQLEHERRAYRESSRLQQVILYGLCTILAVLVISNALAGAFA